MTPERIDRAAVVRRHNPVLHGFDPLTPLSVGNGEFAFTADVTGLQTFPELYEHGCPLGTAAQWGWHSFPLPSELESAAIRPTFYNAHGRSIPYVTDRRGQEKLFDHLRQNPHRLHLGCIGLQMEKADGAPAGPEDLTEIQQTLDLWTGLLESRFVLEGAVVTVATCCHPELDLLAVRVASPLILPGRLRLRLAFPYGSPDMAMVDWDHPERHRTAVTYEALVDRRADLFRELDADGYAVGLAWSEGAMLRCTAPNTFVLEVGESGPQILEACCRFAATAPAGDELPTFAETVAASAAYWERYWSDGGIIDFAGCTDPRAFELERRVILSQFVTAVHCAGSLPPAETGLLCNSWYGKFHLEMHWWHAAHFASWGRLSLLARSLAFYHRILPHAREIAAEQGYAGARWPKMVGPEGRDSPSPIGPLLIWQQPHPLYYAELCYRAAPTPVTLERWREIVFASADFMASYAALDDGRYVLGPPLKTAAENTDAQTAANPAFELAYWGFGLRVAGLWRERLGLAPEPQWEAVRRGMAPLPEADGCYLQQEGMDDTYTVWNWEHPALLGAFGMLPGDGVDPATMRRSVRRVMDCWQWDRKSWGWDFPMVAMAAARSGEPELAIEALLLDVPRNRYLANGHVYQREDLPAYLPANGGLLSAIGMMAAGWEGGPDECAPGFPQDGGWAIRYEGIHPWI